MFLMIKGVFKVCDFGNRFYSFFCGWEELFIFFLKVNEMVKECV